MKGITIILVIILVLLLLIMLSILIIKHSIGNFLENIFGTRSLKEAIDISELDEENTPKSIASMESLVLPSIKKDFPELNVKEIKSMADNTILDYLKAIEKKDIKIMDKYIDTIKSIVSSKIDDYEDEHIKYDNINIHKTVINRYEKNNSVASITTESSLEYYLTNKKLNRKKIQTRFKIEIIYIIDASLVPKEQKLLGLNCPNCGAPISTLGDKTCKYCNTNVKDITKRTWVINSIKEY